MPAGQFPILQDNMYHDVPGAVVHLPAKGTYLLEAVVRGAIHAGSPTGDQNISARLVDTSPTAPVPVNHSDSDVLETSQNQSLSVSAPITAIYTVTGPTSVKLQAFATSGAADPRIVSNAAGRTTLSYVKIG